MCRLTGLSDLWYRSYLLEVVVMLNPYDDALMKRAREKIIWSADTGGMWRLMGLLVDMGPRRPDHIKIDRLFTDSNPNPGLEIIGGLQDMGLRVFDDELIEVPTKAAGLTEVHLAYKPWMLNIMAHACSTGMLDGDPKKIDGLKRFADLCNAAGTLSCGVTVLTSKDVATIAREYNIPYDPNDPESVAQVSIKQVLIYVEMLSECGFTDIVCSPLEVEAIRANHSWDHLTLNTPGVRMPGGDAHDQARVDTPANTIKKSGGRVVIGREITDAEDPAAALERIVGHMIEEGAVVKAA
jgi:orotidine-5'-phosphate decarboxylase